MSVLDAETKLVRPRAISTAHKGQKKKIMSAHNGDSVHLVRLHRDPSRALQSKKTSSDESHSESSTWGNSRRRRRSISHLTSPISLVKRRQRNEQFFFSRPINIFATILLLRLPSPPALPHLSLFSPFLSSFFSPYCDIWVIPSRRCVTMGDRCPLLNIYERFHSRRQKHVAPYIRRRPQPKNYGWWKKNTDCAPFVE